ncbi:MAG: hypothetical protein ACOCPM_04140 [Bacteroidales bacterium]
MSEIVFLFVVWLSGSAQPDLQSGWELLLPRSAGFVIRLVQEMF